MGTGSLLRAARRFAGSSQGEVARRAGTSRETVSAYERGHKSPTLDTAARLLDAVDHDLVAVPRVRFVEHEGRGRPLLVPTFLPRLPVEAAMAVVVLPLHLNWSDPGRRFDLSDRRERARVYEIVLREGTAADILAYVDGALLVDLWPDLVLPSVLRRAWQPVVTGSHAAAS